MRVRVDLDGAGAAEIATGVGFFDHMLTLLARHGLMDLRISRDAATWRPGATTRSRTWASRSGQALDAALGDRAGVERYGSALVPMDECLAQAAVDLSGPPVPGLRGAAAARGRDRRLRDGPASPSSCGGWPTTPA